MMRLISFIIIMSLLSACSYIPKMDQVLPDKRTEYKKSESLPDLEVPPDLTADAINDNMAIPNEEASLSEYQKKRSAKSVHTNTATVVQQGLPNEQWVSVAGSAAEVWPALRTFFNNKGYGLELDDAELGVMETTWSQPVMEGGSVNRYKYKVFSEPGTDPKVTTLFISSQRQEQVMQADGGSTWVDREKGLDTEKVLAGEINTYFNGTHATTSTDPGAMTFASKTTGSSRPLAELKTAEDGNILLSMPEEFTLAWRQAQAAMERAGLVINGQDQSKGAYYITYYGQAQEDKKGWLSKLAFWKDDEPEGISYAVSLTGVGDKTELIVINEKGQWESNQDAERILSAIQNQYNLR